MLYKKGRTTCPFIILVLQHTWPTCAAAVPNKSCADWILLRHTFCYCHYGCCCCCCCRRYSAAPQAVPSGSPRGSLEECRASQLSTKTRPILLRAALLVPTHLTADRRFRSLPAPPYYLFVADRRRWDIDPPVVVVAVVAVADEVLEEPSGGGRPSLAECGGHPRLLQPRTTYTRGGNREGGREGGR